MPHERRLAAFASLGLFLTMFLPWYQRQFFVVISGKLQPASDSQTAWGNFTFVEAAVLLVAAGVLTLLFQRAEGKAFHLPGGDGLVITVAGFWTCALIVWRIFDKQGGISRGQNVISYGIEWGIFVALAVAASLAYAGSRIRAAHRPEPPLPGEDDPPRGGWSVPQDPGPVGPEDRARAPQRYRGSDESTLVSSERSAFPAERDQGPSARRRASSDRPREATSDRPREATRERPGIPSERRAGWLTAPPSHTEQPDAKETPPTDWPAPEWPPRSAARGNRPPKPVPAEDPPTIRARRNPPAALPPSTSAAPLPPSTPAAQRSKRPDDQLTIRLERED